MDLAVLALGVVSGIVLLGPALGRGPLLTYDMVWVPDLGLHRDVLGLGSGLPRAVPSDALVAVLDEVVPGLWLQKVVLLLALGLAGLGASRCVGGPPVARVAAGALYSWNALVVERLVIGHWPVLVGYAIVPWLVVLAVRWRTRPPPALLVLLPLASLSASAGLMSAVVLLAAAWRRGRRRALIALVLAANAPWLVAGLVHAGTATTDPAGARAFALNDEGPVPGPLAALTLGGIWNTEVVPTSRTGALGWTTLAVLVGLAAAGARRWWRTSAPVHRRALLVPWMAGWTVATATWLAPGAVGELGATVPGLGLVRDGARSLVLCAPLLVVLVGHGLAVVAERTRMVLAAALLVAVLLPVALLPDVTWGVGGRLEPAAYPRAWAATRADLQERPPAGDVLVLPLTAFRAPAWNDGRTVFDPLGRYLARPYVASDVLVVSGRPLRGEDPRVAEAEQALRATTPQARAEALLAAGFGAVVLDRSAPGADDVPAVAGESTVRGDLAVVRLDGRPRPVEVMAGAPEVAVVAAWLAFVASPLAGLGALLGSGLAGAVGTLVPARRTGRSEVSREPSDRAPR